jgi:hypothetical protein
MIQQISHMAADILYLQIYNWWLPHNINMSAENWQH